MKVYYRNNFDAKKIYSLLKSILKTEILENIQDAYIDHMLKYFLRYIDIDKTLKENKEAFKYVNKRNANAIKDTIFLQLKQEIWPMITKEYLK